MIRFQKRCPDCGQYVPIEIEVDEYAVPRWMCPMCGVLHEDHTWYHYIDEEERDEIMAHRGRRGLFYWDNGYEIVGIDNSTGSATEEEFPDLAECLAWLSAEIFTVYLLDMWADGELEWIQNVKMPLGSIRVPNRLGGMTADDLLKSLRSFAFRNITGAYQKPFAYADLTKVEVIKLLNGSWFEVVQKSDGRPLYRLERALEEV